MNSLPQTTIIKFVLLLSMVALFTGCPKDDTNVTDSSRYTSVGGVDSNGDPIVYNYTVADIVAHTKAQAPACSDGARIDMNIATSDIASQTTIAVNGTSNGSPLTGGVVAYYVGESYWKDLMIISRMSDGQFNITVSFCPYSTILTSTSSLTSFWAPYGITVASNTVGIGSILSAKNTYVKVEGGSYQSINFGPTTFYPVQIQ